MTNRKLKVLAIACFALVANDQRAQTSAANNGDSAKPKSDGLALAASAETPNFHELTGEEFAQLVTDCGGTVCDVERDEHGVIVSLQASYSSVVEYDYDEMSEVLESIHATAPSPKKPLGDLAQTSVGLAGGTQTQVLGLAEWTIDWKRKTVEATTTDDAQYESSLPSTKSWTGKAKYMFIDQEDSQEDVILAAIDSVMEDPANWNFFPTVAEGRNAFTGKAIIDGITLTSGMGKVVGLDVSLKGTGPLGRVAQIAPIVNADTVTGLQAKI